MHLSTKDFTWQQFSLFGARRHLSESLSISQHLSASFRHLSVATAFHWNTSETFGKSQIIIKVHSASLLYHFPVNLTRHITTTSASQHLSFSQVLIFLLFASVRSLDYLLQWKVKQEAPWSCLSTCRFHLSPISKRINARWRHSGYDINE